MKIKVLLLFLIALAGLGFFFLRKGAPTPLPSSSLEETRVEEPVSFEASFEIFTNGTKRIFTDPKYHNLSNRVYLESSDPSIVHVRAEGVTWGEFFDSLPMKLTKDCLTTGTGQTFCESGGGVLGFFVNDVHTPDALKKEIKPGEHLLITYK
ncbi:hypothetical protein HY502_00460 [Candidatus Woesebacteria bacterium]|nr:hypothetical protein [Candidatus Woesebacteria bacterium]